MRAFFRWLFFLTAVGLVAALVLTVYTTSNRTPRSAFESGLRAAFGPERNADLAFRNFEFALRGAAAAEDRELLIEALKARGRLFAAVGSLPRARQDYEEVLRRYVPDDLESQLALADVLLQLGEDAQASALIDAVLERTPEHGPALAIRAQLDLRYAEAALAEARRLVNLSVPPADRAQVLESIASAASLPRDDTRRLRLLDGLRTHFPVTEERLLQSVLESLETATTRSASARTALVASFASGASQTTLIAYYDLLIRSGRLTLALDFALAAMANRTLPPRPDFLLRTIDLFERNGQPHMALEVVAEHLGGNMPGPNFYATWCRLLYGAERWEDLVIVATAFAESGSSDQRRQAFCYVGLAKAQLGEFDEAQRALRPFLAKEPPEAFPGALALGWRTLARCYREEGRVEEEAGALRMAAAKGRGRMQDEGELWLRLYELGSAQAAGARSPTELEGILTWAMCVAPERIDELMPRWHDLGRRNLEVARVDLRAVFDEMLLAQTFSAPTNAGPYELFELAKLFAARELHPGVIQNCSALLNVYPGFPPAEELLIESRTALGDTAGVLRILEGRMVRLGPTPELVVQIAELGRADANPDRRMVLMRADPSGYARRLMLESLEARGQTSLMVDALLALPEDQVSDEDRLHAARLLVEQGHAEELPVVLDLVSDDPLHQARAAGLRLRAALEALDWESFDREMAVAREAAQVDREALTLVLEELVALGQGERAFALAVWLDSQPGLRSAAVVLRASQAARLLGDRLAAEEGLLRAEAAMTDGAPELGFLIDTVATGDWERVPERVRELRASSFAPGDLSSVILDALAKDPGAAAARLADGAARLPHDPTWALARAAVAELMELELAAPVLAGASSAIDHQTVLAVRGTDGNERDPREVLVLLLAAEHPAWRPWALARCETRTDPDSAPLWHGYMAGREWLRRGRPSRARVHAEALTTGWPQFAAGWDLLESADLAELQRVLGRPLQLPLDEPTLVRWRQREVLGAMPGNPAEEHWMAGLEAERNGDREVAMSAVARAVDLAPGDVRFRVSMARLYALGEDWRPALLAMDIAIRSADAEQRLVVAERVLELHRWILEDPPGASVLGEVAKQRESLELRFASDPLVTLDRARTDLTGWTTTPDRGLSRALARLQRMRDRTRGSALEELRPGATRLWFDFLLDLDPRAARTFAQEEVRLRTADPDLWRMLSEANEANNARTVAVELREFLQASLPAAEDARALVRLRAMGGDDPDGFERAFTAVLVQEDLVEPDGDLALQRARFLVESGRDSWPEASDRLALLWSEHVERYLAPPPTTPPDPVEDGRPPLFGGRPEPVAATDGPWRIETTPEQAARTVDVAHQYARLLAWLGRPEDAAILDEVTRTLEGLQHDRLTIEVLATLRALAPRPRAAAPD